MRKPESTTTTIAGCTHHRSRRMVSPKRRRTRGSWACAMSDEASAADGRDRVDGRAGNRKPEGIFGWAALTVNGAAAEHLGGSCRLRGGRLRAPPGDSILRQRTE